jgi:hypothetical protein
LVAPGYAEDVVTATDDDAPPPRRCPTCGQEGRTRFERCPHCGGSYFAIPRAVRRRRRLIAGAIGAVLIVAIALFAVVLSHDHSQSQAERRVAATRTASVLRARIVRNQRPHHGAARALKPPAGASDAQRRAARAALVHAVERQITADARARVQTGELDGPILGASCGTILRSQDAIPDDRVLTKHIGRYDCVAIKKHVRDIHQKTIADLGHAFVAALDFDTFTYTWCRNTPAQSEAGVPLVFVRLDRACLAATGKALGTGYAASGDPTR